MQILLNIYGYVNNIYNHPKDPVFNLFENYEFKLIADFFLCFCRVQMTNSSSFLPIPDTCNSFFVTSSGEFSSSISLVNSPLSNRRARLNIALAFDRDRPADRRVSNDIDVVVGEEDEDDDDDDDEEEDDEEVEEE